MKNSILASRSEKLDNTFTSLSARFYDELVRQGAAQKFDTMGALAASIDQQLEHHQVIQAVANIKGNISLIQRNIDTREGIRFVSVLLDANEWQTASRLYEQARRESDRSVVSNMSFAFAKYHFYRDHSRKALDLINQITGELPPDTLHHALLIKGIITQQQHNHSQAIDIYRNIPGSSRHFHAARVNMAVAYMRQAWWTDAHGIITELLQDRDITQSDELADRLYTLLGYSLIQHQYYRNSREIFRKVSLHGPYTNQALLGIAITAANQLDYTGALNALKYLKASESVDLHVYESQLLTAYFYEKMQQYSTASAAYTESLTYFQSRISALRQAHKIDSSLIRKQIANENKRAFMLENESINLEPLLPAAFFSNYHLLNLYLPYSKKYANPTLSVEIETLLNKYDQLAKDAIQYKLDENITFITSYMDQARYGQARMYDLASRSSE